MKGDVSNPTIWAQAADAFIAAHRNAIDSLAGEVATACSSALPCLKIGTPKQNRDNVVALIEKVMRSKIELGRGYSTGSWDTDGVFVVTVEDVADTGETTIRASLLLAQTKITP